MRSMSTWGRRIPLRHGMRMILHRHTRRNPPLPRGRAVAKTPTLPGLRVAAGLHTGAAVGGPTKRLIRASCWTWIMKTGAQHAGRGPVGGRVAKTTSRRECGRTLGRDGNQRPRTAGQATQEGLRQGLQRSQEGGFTLGRGIGLQTPLLTNRGWRPMMQTVPRILRISGTDGATGTEQASEREEGREAKRATEWEVAVGMLRNDRATGHRDRRMGAGGAHQGTSRTVGRLRAGTGQGTGLAKARGGLRVRAHVGEREGGRLRWCA
mmetsp:Transcript_132403/g.229631  ORF Transcript_132403/g.229631 Transcript_132403/m.229631 type:complete len:265 (+) Transcript_132403:416-1210(+)